MATIGIRSGSSLDASVCIVSCSGISEEGLVAYLVARRLAAEGFGNVLSLAGVSGEDEQTLEAVRSAPMVMAIDGCEKDCAAKTLEKAGIHKVRHIRITDLDTSEGPSQSTPVKVRKAVEKVKELALK